MRALSREQAPASSVRDVCQHGDQLGIHDSSSIWQRRQATTHGLNGTSAAPSLLLSLLTIQFSYICLAHYLMPASQSAHAGAPLQWHVQTRGHLQSQRHLREHLGHARCHECARCQGSRSSSGVIAGARPQRCWQARREQYSTCRAQCDGGLNATCKCPWSLWQRKILEKIHAGDAATCR